MTIEAVVENKVLELDDSIIVCNNNDYTMHFTFDEQFSRMNNLKCRFISNGVAEDAVVHNGACDVPSFEKTKEVKVGLYGNGSHGVKIASTFAVMKCRHSILCESPT